LVYQKPQFQRATHGSGASAREISLRQPLPPAAERSLLVLRKQIIAVGRSYVNESVNIAREVVEEVDQHKIKYNAFDLKDGGLIPSAMQVCRKSDMAHWADREATPDEIAKIHPFEKLPWFEEVPHREVKGAELELTKANLQQVVGNNNIHRW